jgi:C1A family cysteine protease
MGLYDADGYIDARTWTEDYAPADTMLPLTAEQAAGIPDSFDLRNEGGASPVKDKGKTSEEDGIGICWLFAGIASLESNLLYKGKAGPADPLTILSELHGTYSTFDNSEGDKDCENPRGRKPGVKSTGEPAYGGTRYMAVNYLTRDAGIASWRMDPYYKTDMINKTTMADHVLPKRKWKITEGKPAQYYVKGIRYLPEPVPPGSDPVYLLQVKYHVMTYGGVSCSIYWDDQFVKSVAGDEYSYYDNTSGDNRNHAVTIMGWDDQYPVDKFATSPKGPGAFLVKNCWSTMPAGKYVWISYESANFGMNPYCVSDVQKDFYAHPYKIYQHDKYGYNDLEIPYTDNGKKLALVKNVFQAVQDDKLAGISFYACAACTVDLFCLGRSDPLVKGFGCPVPGYYTVDLSPSIVLPPGSFELIVAYTSVTGLPAYVPLEVNADPAIFNHWQINRDCSFVSDNGSWMDVADIPIPAPGTIYGYVCVKAIIENDSGDTQNLKNAYNTLAAPGLHSGYTDCFAKTAGGFNLEWRLEPYLASTYSKQAIADTVVFLYTVQDSSGAEYYGLVNTGSAADVYLCATIKGVTDSMRKIFKLNLGAVSKNYNFTCDAVAEHDNKSTISGSFDIPGATVVASANGVTSSPVTVQGDKTWKIENFALYDEYGGWKDNYSKTEVTITIRASGRELLAEGVKTVEMQNPVEKTADGKVNVWTTVGLVVAAVLIVGGGAVGTICICKNISVGAGAGAAGGALAGPGGPNLGMNGQGHHVNVGPADTDPLIRRRAFVGEAGRIENMAINYQGPGLEPDLPSVPPDPGYMGGLANKISKGGSVINCHVTGYLNGVNKLGGLFYEGEDVTVKDCTVDLEVEDCAETYAGIAVNLAGNGNQISGVTVKGSAKAGKVAGLVDVMGGGSVKNVGVSLNAEAQNAVSGLLGSSNGAVLENAVVTGSYKAAGGRAAGAILSMNGGSITNCRVSAVLEGASGAFGIAGAMQAGAVIKNCYTACRLTARGAGAAVCGIGEGIHGSPGSVLNCVAIGSHLSGSRPARVSLQAALNCAAYDGMTCDAGVSFISAGEILKSAAAFLAKDLYQELGWDLTVWDIDAVNLFPVIRGSLIPQPYDYPFPCPYPPQNGKFVYPVNQVVAILGANHGRMTNLDWSLSPHLSSTVTASGEFLVTGNSFYVQIAALPVAGDYDLSLLCVLDEHTYGIPVLLEIKN